MDLGKEKTNMNELERKPYSSESMRVRCPHCRKLYLVQYADVKEARPRFECVQCHERFWLSMPDTDVATELTGIPVQMKEAPPAVIKAKRVVAVNKNSEPCPKCFKLISAGTSECPHCGVLIQKMKDLAFTENTVPHSDGLATAWKKVVADYATDATHAEFLRLCQREQNLAFAAGQYGQMQKLMPSDETTRKRISEVQALASVMVPRSSRARGAKLGGDPSRLWQIPLMASVLMMIVGVFVPVFRNMVGVGAAFFFLALAFQIQFRRREP
jgi:hypothetical protein